MQICVEKLELVAELLRPGLRELSRIVDGSLSDSAIGLVVFGKATTGDFDATKDTARTVLVVERIDLAGLKRLAAEGPRLGRHAITAPLIMTPEHIAASLDTFPLEFIEIQQRNVVLFGDDHFAPLVFHDEHVRLQCERELKTAMIALRQGLLASAGDVKMLTTVAGNVVQGLIRILRGILWLKGERSPQSLRNLVELSERQTTCRLPGLHRAIGLSANISWDDFESLYADVAALERAVDSW